MDPLLARVALVLLVVLLSTLAGRVWQRRDGRVEATEPAGRDHREALGLSTEHAGPQAVLFGTETCAPCGTVKSLLDEVGREHDDFRWHYVDAAARLDLADAHGVRRVPTLLVLDDSGEIVARTSGVPQRAALTAAVRGRSAAA